MTEVVGARGDRSGRRPRVTDVVSFADLIGESTTMTTMDSPIKSANDGSGRAGE
jgi:hypothetical protein